MNDELAREAARAPEAPAATAAAADTAPAPPSESPRPAVLDMDPLAAAHELRVGRPCPVCGETLVSIRGPGALEHALGALGVLSEALESGPTGLVLPLVLGQRYGDLTSCRCTRCELVVRNIPVLPQTLLRAGLLLVPGAYLGFLSWRVVSHEAGQRTLLAVVAMLLAVASPLMAYWVVQRPWRKIAARIADARRRWEEERDLADVRIDPAALLQGAIPGKDCPVCGKAPLEGWGANPLWQVGTLQCPRCRLEVPPRPTQLGFNLGLLLAVALVIAGAYVLNVARDLAGNELLLKGMLGIVLAGAGLYLGFQLQGAGDEPARRELEARKRRHERRKRGLASRDDDDAGAWFGENLEAVVVAVILALVIRHFVMEAFVIPTGSMAPTLLGDHYEQVCPSCRYRFAVAKSESATESESVTARCPLCGKQEDVVFHSPDVHGGNKILVNKFLYKLSEPDRWNVIVFKFPRNPSRNFIKRLVGLPGEWLKVDVRGDVWTRKDERAAWILARKPKTVQDELWMPVYDSRFPSTRRDEPAWTEDGLRWTVRRTADGEELEASPGKGEASIDYAREIKDNYGYNNKSFSSDPKNAVGDVRLRATVVPGKEAKSVKLALVERTLAGERVLAAELPAADVDVGSSTLTLSAGGAVLASKPFPPLKRGQPAEVALAYSDEHATLAVNGADVLEWDDPRAATPDDAPRCETSKVRLAVDGGGAVFRDVKIDRDVFYVSSGHSEFDPNVSRYDRDKASFQGVHIPERCYFALGDNSPNSQDGREWGFVHEPHLIGRAFLVFWPLWQVKLIR